jgi:trk system potassium uptake protein
MSNPSKYIIVIGCGRLGSLLSTQLSQAGHSVVVIDKNEASFRKLSVQFSGFTIQNDASELHALRKARIEQADCLLALTNQDNTNLMVSQIAKVIFNVPLVIARSFDPQREEVYRQLGIEVISPTKLSADAFSQALANSMPVT